MVIPNLRMRLPPLSSLAAFEAACRHRSFSRAASELNLTQAAVSRQIASLERHLGVPLFERRRHDVVVTAEGERFARQVNPALIAIGDAAISLKAGSSDELVIFSELCLSAHWLLPRLSRFQDQHPKLSLKILTSNKPIETEAEQFDVALAYGSSHSPRFLSQTICTENLVAVCSPSFRKKLPKTIGPSELAAATLIHFEQRGSNWMDWSQFLANFGVRPQGNTRLVFNTYNSAVDAALEGHGVALGWGLVVESLLGNGRLVDIEGFSVKSPDALCAHRPTNRNRSPGVDAFINWLQVEMLTSG